MTNLNQNTLKAERNFKENVAANLKFNQCIRDADILLHIEKVPNGLNFMDFIRFKNVVSNSINGNIIKIFNLKTYLIYMYTRIPKIKNMTIPLLLKIDVFTKIIGQQSNCDLWIVKDLNYLCMGILHGAPVFIKIFNDACDVTENIDLMVKTMNEYTYIENIRFFGCHSSEFGPINYNICEYSTVFVSNFINGHTSIDSYCKEYGQLESIKTDKARIFLMMTLGMCLASFGFHLLRGQMQYMVRDLRKELVNVMSQSRIPSMEEYRYMQQINDSIAQS